MRGALEDIMPHLQLHSGDWQLIGIDGSMFMARLAGPCTSCKLSGASVGGAQARLVDKIRGFSRLILVAGTGGAVN
ncbi:MULTISPECIES: NifU family protein [Bradyrhizobium]|uniref:NifU family protein n=1 Tax=Bradyrhizobium TaxID=374 RepID=UPI0035167718